MEAQPKGALAPTPPQGGIPALRKLTLFLAAVVVIGALALILPKVGAATDTYPHRECGAAVIETVPAPADVKILTAEEMLANMKDHGTPYDEVETPAIIASTTAANRAAQASAADRAWCLTMNEDHPGGSLTRQAETVRDSMRTTLLIAGSALAALAVAWVLTGPTKPSHPTHP